MTKKILTLALGITLASGLAFCKKEEAKMEEAVAPMEEAAKAAVTDTTKKVETEVKKKVEEGMNTAKDAVNTKMPK